MLLEDHVFFPHLVLSPTPPPSPAVKVARHQSMAGLPTPQKEGDSTDPPSPIPPARGATPQLSSGAPDTPSESFHIEDITFRQPERGNFNCTANRNCNY